MYTTLTINLLNGGILRFTLHYDYKVQDKNTQLIAVLINHFGKNINLAQLKLFSKFICASCKVQTVGFEKLAAAFESAYKSDSSLRLIQRFVAEYQLDSELIPKFIFNLLPHKPPFRLALHRTNWKIGESKKLFKFHPTILLRLIVALFRAPNSSDKHVYVTNFGAKRRIAMFM